MTESDMSSRVTAKQQKLIEGLLTGLTIATAAKQAGINERTAYRFLKLPYFQSAYREAQAQLWDESIGQLRLGVKVALAVMRKHATAEVEPTAATQMRAAQVWLEQAVTLYKMSELEAKVADLERLIKGQGKT